MLGASHGATLGIHYQVDWSDYNPQYSYQTTGWVVTGKAFGVEPANWWNPDPCNHASVPSGSANPSTMPDVIIAWGADAIYSTGIGNLNPNASTPGWVAPGNAEVTWSFLWTWNLDTNASPYVVDVSGLAKYFPSGFVVQTVSALAGGTGKPASTNIGDVLLTWNGNTSPQILAYTTYRAIGGLYDNTALSTVGLSAPSAAITDDAIELTAALPVRYSSPFCAAIITDQPVITQDPIGGTYGSGASFALTAAVIGIPTLHYQWRTNGIPIPGANAPTYSVSSASPGNGGNYDLVVTNSMGSATSAVATVTIIGTPAITANIRSTTNYYNLDQLFVIGTAGAQPMSYQWLRNGTNIPGATAAALAVANLQSSDNGSTFKVIVTNTLGAITSAVATLSVTTPPYDGFNYSDGSLTGQGVSGGSWGGLWANSGPPNYNGDNSVVHPGLGYLDATSQLATAGGAVEGGTSGAVDFESIRALAGKIGGSGTAYVSFIGQVSSDAIGIELVEDTVASSYSRLFLGVPLYGSYWGFGWYPTATASSVRNTNLSFLVYRLDFTSTNTQVRLYINPTLASEPATPAVAGSADWFQFNKVRIVERQHLNYSAGQIDELRIGGTWASIAPTVPRTDPPSFVRDLAGVTAYAYAGGNAGMSVVASGAPTLHYQWKRGTTLVGTDSSALALTSLTTANSGDYHVTVSNTYGSTNSVTNHLTVVASPDLYTAQVAPDSPGAYWPLNESVAPTANDYSGAGNNGTQNGGLTLGVAGPRPPACHGFSSGKTAYRFDGSTAYIDCGTAPSLSGTTDFAVEAWINTTNTADTTTIIQQRSATGFNGEYVLDVNANGTVYFTIFGGGATQYGITSPAAARRVNDGNWHHVAAVRSGGANGFLYIDGSLVASATNAIVAPLDPTIGTYIGADARDSGSYFNGAMSDVAIYNYALTAARIGDHASKGVLGSSSLKLNVVSGGWVEDSKPVGTPHDGMNFGASWAASSTDAIPVTRTGVAQFLPSGAQIAIPANADFNSPTGTICFWMLTPLPPAGHGMMLVDRRTSAGLVMFLDGTPSGGIDVQYSGNAGFAAGGYVVDGNWHHVALVYDQSASGTVAVYVDGGQIYSQPNTAAWSWPTTQQIELARSHDTYWQEYDGQMDDFRIYNRVLSGAEISTIYAAANSNSVLDSSLTVRYNFGTAAGVGTGLSWPIGVLQSSPAVGPSAVWTPISTTSPFYPFLPPYGLTNSASFYRLKL